MIRVLLALFVSRSPSLLAKFSQMHSMISRFTKSALSRVHDSSTDSSILCSSLLFFLVSRARSFFCSLHFLLSLFETLWQLRWEMGRWCSGKVLRESGIGRVDSKSLNEVYWMNFESKKFKSKVLIFSKKKLESNRHCWFLFKTLKDQMNW